MENDNHLLKLCAERFSARKFTDEPVSTEDLAYVLEAVRLAPSAVNFQPWKFVIARSEEAKAKLRECYNREWFATAPMYIIGLKDTAHNWVRRYDQKPHGDVDVSIATEHLCLAATERGLGTCWVCAFDTGKFAELFPQYATGIGYTPQTATRQSADDPTPPAWEAVVIVPIGHIAPDCPRKEKERKTLSEICEEI